MRIGSDTRPVFPQRNISDVVIAILDAPVIADCLTEDFGCQTGGGDIKRRLVAGFPNLASGVKCPSFSIYLHNRVNQVPLDIIAEGWMGKDLHASTFNTVVSFRNWFFILFAGQRTCGKGLTVVEQGLLVAFDLHNHIIPCFFAYR